MHYASAAKKNPRYTALVMVIKYRDMINCFHSFPGTITIIDTCGCFRVKQELCADMNKCNSKLKFKKYITLSYCLDRTVITFNSSLKLRRNTFGDAPTK